MRIKHIAAAAIFALIPAIASAEPICAPKDELAAYLGKMFHEFPMTESDLLETNPFIKGFVLYVSKQSWSITLPLATFPDIHCVFAAGMLQPNKE